MFTFCSFGQITSQQPLIGLMQAKSDLKKLIYNLGLPGLARFYYIDKDA